MSDTLDFPGDDEVLGQGFRFRPIWWTPRVCRPWGHFLNDLPAIDRGYHTITRSDLLKASERSLPEALLAGYVWGTGSSAFLVGRRARVFRDNEDGRIADCLEAATEEMRTSGPVDAYTSMLRGQTNNLRHLGPSFFTKFLYAADSTGTDTGKALIFDQFVATALQQIEGWDISRVGPWAPKTYERWLDFAHSLADREDVRADAVELAYFNRGRGL